MNRDIYDRASLSLRSQLVYSPGRGAGDASLIQVAIAEDHPEMRTALRLLLKFSKDMQLVSESSNGQDAVHCVRELGPDVLVMDVRMPVLDGWAAMKQIRDLAARTRVIIISSYTGSYMTMRAEAAGAQGYLPKDDVGTHLLPAIRAVHLGETFFRA